MPGEAVTTAKSKVLCKYFLNGVCKFGDACMFSHDRTDLPSQVCTYYLAGCCAFGDNCRYEHVKPDWHPTSKEASGSEPPVLVEKPATDNDPAAQLVAPNPNSTNAWLPAEESYGTESYGPESYGTDSYGTESYGTDETWYPWSYMHNGYSGTGYETTYYDAEGNSYYDGSYERWGDYTAGEGSGGEASIDSQCPEEVAWDEHGPWGEGVTDPADMPLCVHFSQQGWCPWGEQCTDIHGELCETCQKYCLHPYNEQDAEKHTQSCAKRHARLAARLRSAAVECCICYERVLQKDAPNERKFGLMDCEHAFCLSCIRSWRSNTEVDVESASRTCPVCRTTTHFITPSSLWPSNSEEKSAIVNGYKAKLSKTDCKHFSRGEGTCPFGNSCFYRHAYKDGSLQEHVLRKAGTADGGLKVLQPLKLSSFFETPQAQRLLNGRRRRR